MTTANDKKYYTASDDLTSYWNERYVEWDAKLSEGEKQAVFKGKDEWFETRFARILPPKQLGENVLDVGCGNAMFSPALLQRYSHYWGLDTSEKALEIARRYFGFINSDSRGRKWDVDLYRQDQLLPFTENYFDCVFSCTVLQHMPIARRIAMIGEIKRVLKPGGRYVGLEMQGNTQAADMPPFPEHDWCQAWLPLQIAMDLPPEHPDWWADNVWVGRLK